MGHNREVKKNSGTNCKQNRSLRYFLNREIIMQLHQRGKSPLQRWIQFKWINNSLLCIELFLMVLFIFLEGECYPRLNVHPAISHG